MKRISGKSIILRVEIHAGSGRFGELVSAIAAAGGDIIALDVIETNERFSVRDITVQSSEPSFQERVKAGISELTGITLIHVSDRTFLLHLGGKISIQPKTPIQNRDDLSRVYTPDVARVCMAIHEDEQQAYSLTIKRNTVAVISDGTAVLGLGDIGPSAAMPVMEGKSMLFKQLADVDAFPLCLNTQDTDEIVAVIKAVAPAFGGINLEDISSPRCFEIEQRLKQELSIPVFHDDQHGTAVVLLAALLNALKLTGKSIHEVKIVLCGIGAAGMACSRMLLSAGVQTLLAVDKDGLLTMDNALHPEHKWLAERVNPEGRTGTLQDALKGADVFIGLSRGGLLRRGDVLAMAEKPILFAMANPEPEILPDDIEDIVAVAATGRSDYPNQVNNVLCFPGMFRAALDCRASDINEEMKLAAAEAIASIITDDELNKHYIIPTIFNKSVVTAIRKKVIEAAIRTGVAGKIPYDFR
jgi:malate dehydrogenase (oxaloacetate-decarboxylating)